MKVQVYRRKDGKWSWRLVNTRNNRKVATDGAQGYSRRVDARDMVEVIFGDRYEVETLDD